MGTAADCLPILFQTAVREKEMYKKVNGRWQTVERTGKVEEKKQAVSSDLVQEMLKK